MATLELNSWSQFKQTCIVVKNLNCQYTESDRLYDLYGPDENGLLWHTSILKSNPAGLDQADFESNYKTKSFNFAIGTRPYSFSSPDFLFNAAGILATVPMGTVTNIDFLVPGAPGTFLYLNGAVAITHNAVFGDYVNAYIIDKNNVLGFGANATLASYINKWYIDPNNSLDLTTPYAAKPPAGVFIRIVYTSTGNSDVGVAINYRLHKPL